MFSRLELLFRLMMPVFAHRINEIEEEKKTEIYLLQVHRKDWIFTFDHLINEKKNMIFVFNYPISFISTDLLTFSYLKMFIIYLN
jgi:hypothetical protein